MHRKLGVAEATFPRWEKQFAGMGMVEIRRLKQLEGENARLRRLMADLNLHKTMPQDVLGKKTVRRGMQRGACEVCERRAYSAMWFGRCSHRY